MFRKIFYRILAPRHPWRKVSFSELSEMYLTGFLKNFAHGLVGVFIPLYLLKNGYSFETIFIYYAVLYGITLPIDYISARLTARFGPKHVMRVGFLFQFVTALLLSQIKVLPHAIIVIAFFQACSASLYWLPYHVDFSKIKHNDHSGKELGWLQLMEKAGGILGPFLGGLLATFYGGSSLFYAAAALLAGAVIILMLSNEPVQTKQKLNFTGLLTFKDLRSTVSYVAFVSENSLSILLWPTYLAVVVFSADSYLKIGSVSSISIAAAALLALPLGKFLDSKKGSSMIRFGTVLNSIVHLIRPFIGGFGGATAVATVNEPNTLVYRLAYLKGFYDNADDYPGQRIAYIFCNEIVAHLFCFVIWTLLAVIAMLFADSIVFVIGFVIAALLSLIIQCQRYKAIS